MLYFLLDKSKCPMLKYNVEINITKQMEKTKMTDKYCVPPPPPPHFISIAVQRYAPVRTGKTQRFLNRRVL
jgi:hypothetical protein